MRRLLLAVAIGGLAMGTDAVSLQGQTTNRDNAGLHLDGINPAAVQRLVAHVKKCRSDSRTFRHILDDLRSRTEGSDKYVRLSGHWNLMSMIGHAGPSLGELFVDLSDLQVLPDPVTNGRTDNLLRPLFNPLPYTPTWATTVCGWLGHEIAELLEDVVDGKRDREVHHYEIAIAKEDSINWDYSRERRARGEDCGEEHENHDDVLIEIKGDGVERFHMSRDLVTFDPDGSVEGVSKSGRLAWVEYQADAIFPGRRAESADCRSPAT